MPSFIIATLPRSIVKYWYNLELKTNYINSTTWLSEKKKITQNGKGQEKKWSPGIGSYLEM